MANRRIKKGQ